MDLIKLHELLMGPSFICPKHNWSMGTYCTACRDEALELYQAMMNHKPPGWSWTGIDLARGKDWTGVKVMSAPTEAQLKDPKWWDGSAPQSATHFDCARGRFFKQVGGVWHQCFQEYATRWQVAGIAPTKAHLIKRPTKPAAPEWDGKLPSPTVRCEMQDAWGAWVEVKIIAQYDGFSFGWSPDRKQVYFSDDPSEFRPLRTQAERERDELVKTVGLHLAGDPQEIADAIIAAGWRKGE